mgnify:CR=1 FL=1
MLFRSCHLPVVLDCTCSGIRHYAALLRDESMASLVNLMPSDKPQDIYSALIAKVLDILRADDHPDAEKIVSDQQGGQQALGVFEQLEDIAVARLLPLLDIIDILSREGEKSNF